MSKKTDPIFVETGVRNPFPEDTMKKLKREISKKAEDLEQKWDSPIKLVNSVFKDTDVPIPGAHLKDRWKQYEELIRKAVNELSDSRGIDAEWSQHL